MARKEVLEDIIRPVVEGLGYNFWGLEFHAQGKRSMLRVFIDSEQGITVDDCESVSRQTSAVMDVEDPVKGEYTLEISSPGLDRPLFNETQFRAQVGSVVEIKLQIPFEGRRKFKGLLCAVDNEEVTIQLDSEEFTFPLEMVDKANVVPQY